MERKKRASSRSHRPSRDVRASGGSQTATTLALVGVVIAAAALLFQVLGQFKSDPHLSMTIGKFSVYCAGLDGGNSFGHEVGVEFALDNTGGSATSASGFVLRGTPRSGAGQTRAVNYSITKTDEETDRPVPADVDFVEIQGRTRKNVHLVFPIYDNDVMSESCRSIQSKAKIAFPPFARVSLEGRDADAQVFGAVFTFDASVLSATPTWTIPAFEGTHVWLLRPSRASIFRVENWDLKRPRPKTAWEINGQQ